MLATASHPMARPLAIGLLTTFVLFWALHLLIVRGHKAAEATQALPTIDFVRLKKNSELETRQRQKPQKPPPPKQPPPPKMNVSVQAQQQQAPVPFKMPSMNLATNISGGPFLGNFSSAGDLAGDGELIPMMRLAPQYPRQALRDGIDGEVTLEITVGPDGSVTSARVKSAKPRGVFESAAVSAAYKGKFRPKVEDGKPVTTKGTYTVVFKMGKE